MTAKGTRPGIIRTADTKKNEGENPDTSENPEQPETPENPEGPEKPSIGKPFPEELKDKIIYKEITKDAAPYNEDGDGTKRKAVSLSLCAGSNGKCGVMLKMLEERAVCIFDVVDQEKEPALLLYSWTLDGKTGQVIKPENPEQPETPEEPKFRTNRIILVDMRSRIREMQME